MTEIEEQRSLSMRQRINDARDRSEQRHPGRYDWGRGGRADGSPEALAAEQAEAALEDALAIYVSTGRDDGMGAAFNSWLKTLEV